jgi:hypothetical protein
MKHPRLGPRLHWRGPRPVSGRATRADALSLRAPSGSQGGGDKGARSEHRARNPCHGGHNDWE